MSFKSQIFKKMTELKPNRKYQNGIVQFTRLFIKNIDRNICTLNLPKN